MPDQPSRTEAIAREEEQKVLARIRREMLTDIDPSMSAIETYDGPRPDPRARTTPNAEVRDKDPRIFVNRNSPTFKAAIKGRPDAVKALAAMIDHEHRHVYGADESGAYTAQIDRLKRLGAPRKAVEEVERSRDYITRRDKR